MCAAWPPGKLPLLKLAAKSCFLICPTEWKWGKTVQSLSVEVALLFLWPNSCGCWQNKPRAQNNQLQFTPGDVYLPCSLGSLPKEGTSSFAMSHVWRQSNTGNWGGLNRRNWIYWMKECNVHTQAKEAGALWEGKLGSSWQVHSIKLAQKVIQDEWQKTGAGLIWKLWEL